MKIKICLAAMFGFLLSSSSLHAQGKLNVVGTTEDLAAIAREVGGDHINVDSIAKGYQDPHFVEAKPSFILKLQKADILILVGRDLEIGWLPPLIQQSRNSKVQVGADGFPARVQLNDVATAGVPDRGGSARRAVAPPQHLVGSAWGIGVEIQVRPGRRDAGWPV